MRARKCIATLVSAAMAMYMVPAVALAEVASSGESAALAGAEAEATVIAEGYDDYGMEWSIDSNGVLTVDYSGDYPAGSHPFSGLQYTINSVKFTGNITSLGGMFYNCDKILSIEIPSSVKGVSSNAFYSCSNLKSVLLPSTMTGTIGMYAFSRCSSLEEIAIPPSVTQLGDYAFNNCALRSVVVPGSVSSIGARAFENNATLKTVTFAQNAGELSIGEYAFSGNAALESVSFAACNGSVTFGDRVFNNCTSLSSIQLPSKLKSIGSYAFSNCGALTEMTIPAPTTSIGSYAFYRCTGLSSFAFAEGSKLTAIGDRAFCRCTGLSSIDIPRYVTSFGDAVFDSCSANLVVTSNSKTVCDALGLEYVPSEDEESPEPEESVLTYTMGEEGWIVTGFSGDVPSKFDIPAEYAGQPVVAIKADAFRNNTTIVQVSIPASVKTIGSGAFYGCTNLGGVSFAEGSQLETINYNAFAQCTKLFLFSVPSSLKAIGSEVFSGCNSLELSFPEDSQLATVHGYAFAGVKAVFVPTKSIYDLVANSYYDKTNIKSSLVSNGFSYIIDGEGIVVFGYSGSGSDISIPDTINGKPVVGINDGAFRDKSITSVVLPATIESIGARAFYCCRNLTSIGSFPANLRSIGEYAFYSCERLGMLGSFPEGIETIGAYAFAGCWRLSSVSFEGSTSLNTIGNGAFDNCSNLSSVGKLPASLEQLGSYAFRGCRLLSTVSLSECTQLTSIGNYAFQNCTNLSGVIAIHGNADATLGDYAFANTGIKSASLTGFKSIGQYAFAGNENLVHVEVGEGLEIIYSYAFQNTRNLRTTKLPASATLISPLAFEGSCKLLKILAPEGSYAAAYASSLDRSTFQEPTFIEQTPEESFLSTITAAEGSIDALAKQVDQAENLNAKKATFTQLLEKVEPIEKQIALAASILPPALENAAEHQARIQADTERLATLKTRIEQLRDAAPESGLVVEADGSITVSPDEGTVFVASSAVYNLSFNGSSYTEQSFNIVPTVTTYLSAHSTGNYDSYATLYELSASGNLMQVLSDDDSGSGNNYSFSYALQAGKTYCVVVRMFNTNATGAFQAHFGLNDYDFDAATGTLTINGSGVLTSAAWSGLGSSVRVVRISEGFTRIADYAFRYCHGLQSVEIPSSVEEIGREAFYNCYSLSSVTFADNSRLRTIGNEAFRNCSKLKSIAIPDNVWQIGNYAFYNCRNLVEAFFSKDSCLSDLGRYAFAACPKLKPVAHSEYAYLALLESGYSPKAIYDAATGFYYLYNSDGENTLSITSFESPVSTLTAGSFVLASADEGAVVTRILSKAFQDNQYLLSVTLPSTVRSIGARAFSNCDNLVAVNLSSDLERIDAYAFAGCPKLGHLVLGENVYSVHRWAFGWSQRLSVSVCTLQGYKAARNAVPYEALISSPLVTEDGLMYVRDYTSVAIMRYVGTAEDVVVPSKIDERPVKSILDYAFENAPIYTVSIPASVTSVGVGAFRNCQNLESAVFAGGSKLTSLGSWAFAECAKLRSMSIPNGVKKIASYCFGECGSLKTLVFRPGSLLETIASDAFRGCTSLKELVTPASLTNIDERAFRNCTSLEKLVLNEGLQALYGEAFGQCPNLKSVALPASLLCIAEAVFSGCNKELAFTAPEGSYAAEYAAAFDRSSLKDGVEVDEPGAIITRPEISICAIEGTPGTAVTADVSVANNTGIAGMTFQVTYDPEALEFTGISRGDLTAGCAVFKESSTQGAVTVLWSAGTNIAEDGTLARLNFTIKPGAQAGKHPLGVRSISNTAVDENAQPVMIRTHGNELFVRSVLAGDVSEDGVLDIRDVVLLQQALASGKTFTGVELLVRDYNRDGLVTVSDLLGLVTYVSTNAM